MPNCFTAVRKPWKTSDPSSSFGSCVFYAPLDRYIGRHIDRLDISEKGIFVPKYIVYLFIYLFYLIFFFGGGGGAGVDCEQSLSFPSIFLAFLRASVELWSSEQRAAKPRDARARRKRKKKETAVVFLIFSICRF